MKLEFAGDLVQHPPKVQNGMGAVHVRGFGQRLAALMPELRRIAERLCHRRPNAQADAGDALQQAILRALQYSDRYHHVENLSGLMARIITNEFYNLCRAEVGRPLVPWTPDLEGSLCEQLDSDATTSDRWWLDLERRQIDAAMEELPLTEREALVLFERLKLREIGPKVGGKSESAVAGILRRGRIRLSAILTKRHGPKGHGNG